MESFHKSIRNGKSQAAGLCFAALVLIVVHSAAGGDNCVSVTVIPSLPYTDTGTTTGQTNDFNTTDSCAIGHNSNAPDVIYRFSPTVSGRYVVSLCGSLFDTVLELRTGGFCPGNTQIACDDDACGTASMLRAVIVAGQYYYVIVDGYGTSSGVYVLNIMQDTCSITCQPGDVIECAETPGIGHAANDCDGGCYNLLYGGNASFQDITVGQTVCGQCFTYIGPNNSELQDLDCYRFTLAQRSIVQVQGRAMFDMGAALFRSACPESVLSVTTAQTCSTFTLISGVLAAGVYVFEMNPQQSAGLDVPQPYRCTLTRQDPCAICQQGDVVECPETVDSSNRRIDCDGGPCLTFYGGTPSYGFLSPGQTVCGQLFGYSDGTLDYRDTDWYRFSLVDVGAVTVTLFSYYPAWIEVGPYLSASCLGLDYRGQVAGCTLDSLTTPDLSAGDYVMEIFPTTFGPSLTPAPYRATLANQSVRPECLAHSLYGQQPTLPSEGGNAYPSDSNTPFRQLENYAVPADIGSIRFWGLGANYGGGTPPPSCVEQPMPFDISFYTNSGGQPGTLQCSYNVSVVGTPVFEDTIGSVRYRVLQFETLFEPPCAQHSGWVAIRGGGNADCDFFWQTGVSGNGTHLQYNGATPSLINNNLAFCLGQGCSAADSVVISILTPSLDRQLDFFCEQAGLYQIWSTSDHNAEYPATFVTVGQANLSTGHNTWIDSSPAQAYMRYVVVQSCSTQ